MPVGPSGFTDADVDRAIPTPSTAANKPDVGRLVPILKKVRAALDATVGTVASSSITGAVSAWTELAAALGGKAPTSHTHSRTGGSLTGFGTAAGLDVPAAGQAASGQVVKGDDPRINAGVWAPLVHTQAISTITGLQAAIDATKLDPLPLPSFTPTVGTITLEEYAEAAGTINRLTHRLTAGSMTYKIQIGGVDVTGLTALSPGSTQAQVSATGAAAFAVGQRTTMVISSVTTPGTFSSVIKRTLT